MHHPLPVFPAEILTFNYLVALHRNLDWVKVLVDHGADVNGTLHREG